MNSAADHYLARFRKAFDYIDAHLDEDLSVERLAGIAAFSKYHFHRQFTALFGVGVYRYVQMMRLKRAAYQLAFRSDSLITDIALASGYEGPEAFSRAFRKNIGQSPSEFRQQPQWQSWHAIYQPIDELRSNHMSDTFDMGQVSIVNFKQTAVAVLEHRGDPELIGDSIRKFIEWRKQNKLPPRSSATFNICYDHPLETAAEDFRMDLCAATDQAIAANVYGVVGKVIPEGRCAVLRYIGSDARLEKAAMYLYAQWLPRSGEEAGDFPLYLQRVSFFPDVPEHEAATDVFLPLK